MTSFNRFLLAAGDSFGAPNNGIGLGRVFLEVSPGVYERRFGVISFRVFDGTVITNRSNLITTYATTGRVAVSGNLAVSTSFSGATGLQPRGVNLINITNPDNIIQVGGIGIEDNLIGCVIDGGNLYIGDGGTPNIRQYDISNPASPTQTNTLSNAFISGGSCMEWGGGVNGILLFGRSGKVGIAATSGGLSAVGEVSVFSGTIIRSIAVDIDAGLAFAVVDDTDVFGSYRLSVVDYISQTEVGTVLVSSTTANRALRYGDYVCVYGGTDFVMVDVSTPSVPVVASSTTVPTGSFWNGFISGDKLLAYTEDSGVESLNMVDLSNPDNILYVGTFNQDYSFPFLANGDGYVEYDAVITS